MLTTYDIVYQELPFLVAPDDDVTVNNEIYLSRYFLQPYLGKTDAEVEDENAYSVLEKMLVAYYASYNIVLKQSLASLGGEGGDNPNAQYPIKKVKADVVETEFDTDNDGILILSTEEILAGLKQKICDTAQTLEIKLPLCSDVNKSTVILPFKVYH